MRLGGGGLASLSCLALALGLGGCGGSEGGKPKLTVSAAASLKNAFEGYGPRFKRGAPRFSFAGSDELAAQIRSGVRPDVYAAANTKLPDRLFREGLVQKPIRFARNRLVVAVPAGSRDVSSVHDLARPGVELVIGSESVPIGAYTREVLGRLPRTEERRVLANVRSNEPDVVGITGKLTQGAADAGFLYVTDVAGTRGKVRAIELPKGLRPDVEYGAAVVKGAKEPAAARAFIESLLSGPGLAAMKKAGFGPPPK